jgi:DNA-binding beta-propeller fold protein YncE
VGAGLSTERIRVTFMGRKQHFSAEDKATYDVDIQSPKSVNIHPSGEKYYVNSLEGGKTVVYDFQTGEKLKVISHQFSEEDLSLWAPPSGFYAFRHYHEHTETFTGKPVESTFSHGGRYLWVPYYRRSFDLNAQDPSAMAVIDTERDEIVRLFETGPLPKMVATSPDGKRLAVTHWGNNTVGLMDISSDRPEDWYYMVNIIVDYQLNLNYSLTHKVDRDVDSGYCLRGTVFTPDNRFLFVGCMGSGGGIAVIDLENNTYLGRVMGAMSNLRHLVIRNGFLYASINSAGYVQRIPLAKFLAACSTLDGNTVKKVKVDGWVSCKVPAGARTIDLSPDNHFIFAACNFSSCLAVVDAVSMKLLGTIPADSYPVGLDVSLDGRYVFMTSQGRTTGGGNAVNIFEVTYQ